MSGQDSNEERMLKVNANSPADLKKLSQNQFQLQVAKSVARNGKLMFNVVWRSTSLAPVIMIKWKPVYALSWTADTLGDGVSVSTGGNWKQCNLGQAVDIDENGYFVASTTKADPTAMLVGKNNFKAQSKDGIHLLVGVQNAAGEYDVIFVDPTAIGLNMSASLQPQEKLQWWYEAGSKQATMFSSHVSPFEEGDFSKPDVMTSTFKKESKYIYDEGVWNTAAMA